MSGALLPIGFVALMAIVAAVLDGNRKKRYRSQARAGLEQITLIRKLLEHLPQHRGLANAYLNGDASFLEKLKALQSSLENDFNAINQTELAPLLAQRRTQITHEWQQLKQDLLNLPPPVSFSRHSELISQVIYLIEDIADYSGLTRHHNPAVNALSRTGFTLLPQIVEICGQSRGMGTGAIAKGSIPTPLKIKLTFLHKRLDEQHQQISRLMAGSGAHFQSGLLENSNSATTTLLTTLDSELLSGAMISIEADAFFNIGSKAVESNLALLDAAIEQMRELT